MDASELLSEAKDIELSGYRSPTIKLGNRCRALALYVCA